MRDKKGVKFKCKKNVWGIISGDGGKMQIRVIRKKKPRVWNEKSGGMRHHNERPTRLYEGGSSCKGW